MVLTNARTSLLHRPKIMHANVMHTNVIHSLDPGTLGSSIRAGVRRMVRYPWVLPTRSFLNCFLVITCVKRRLSQVGQFY